MSAELGYHVVATRDVQQDEIILKEDPIVQGPKILSLPLCLGCGRRVKIAEGTEVYICSNCGWPLCGPHCEIPPLPVPECNLMKERGFRAKINLQEGRKEVAHYNITPMRCLLLISKDPYKYETIMKLQSHLEKRKDTILYRIFQTNIVGFLRKALGMTEYSEETVLKVTDILDKNSTLGR